MLPPWTDNFELATGAGAADFATKGYKTRGVRGTLEISASQACVVTVEGPMGGIIAAATLAGAGASVLVWTSPLSAIVVRITNGVAAPGRFACVMAQSREFATEAP